MQSKHSDIPQSVGLFRRLGALVYDVILLLAVLFVASLFIVVPFKIVYGHPFYLVYIFYIYGISFIYLGWFWTHGGQTLAMRTWHIRLQRIDGQSITWKWALYRFFSVLMFWFPAGAGYLIFQENFNRFIYVWIAPLIADYLWCLFNSDRMALHDVLSQTRLVKI